VGRAGVLEEAAESLKFYPEILKRAVKSDVPVAK
jgi:hypothetical protein